MSHVIVSIDTENIMTSVGGYIT